MIRRDGEASPMKGFGSPARGEAMSSVAAQAEAAQQFRAAMVASTFANVELQSTQETLKQYQHLFEQATRENSRLQDLLKERDSDALQVMEYLRNSLEIKARALREAELRLERCNEDFQKEHAAALQSLRDQLSVKDDMLTELRRQLSGARDKLAEFAEFAIERQHLNTTIAHLNESLRNATLEHEKELTKIKFASLEEKVKLRAVEKAMNERFEAEVHDRAMRLVDRKSQDIREANQALTKEKNQLEAEVQRLTQLLQSSRDAADVVRRETELAKESLAEYARQGTRLTVSARESARASRELELRCSELSRALQQQRDTLSREHREEVDTLRAELEAARRAANAMREDLKKMRQLARGVMEKRSYLETFFNEAIDYTREQQALEKAKTDSRSAQKRYHAQRNGLSWDTKTPRGQGTFLLKEKLEEITGASLTARSGQHATVNSSGIPDARSLSLAVRERLRPGTEGERRRRRSSATLPHVASDRRAAGDLASIEPQSARDEDGHQNATVDTRFASLSWADKEKIIAALLLELNRAFYAGKQPAVRPPVDDDDAVEEQRVQTLTSDTQDTAAWRAGDGYALTDAALNVAHPLAARAPPLPRPPPSHGSRPATGTAPAPPGSVLSALRGRRHSSSAASSDSSQRRTVSLNVDEAMMKAASDPVVE